MFLRQLLSQLSKAAQPGLRDVKVKWLQHDIDPVPPIQAPKQIMSVFNGSQQVVYGFVPNCTQVRVHSYTKGYQF